MKPPAFAHILVRVDGRNTILCRQLQNLFSVQTDECWRFSDCSPCFVEHCYNARIVRITEKGKAGDLGNGLLQQFETLANQLRGIGRNPVALPPGRARLATSPLAIGLPPHVKTTGIVAVDFLATRAEFESVAKRISTLRRTSSSANSCNRPGFLSSYLKSMLMFFPST